jgi:hypothetical protein
VGVPGRGLKIKDWRDADLQHYIHVVLEQAMGKARGNGAEGEKAKGKKDAPGEKNSGSTTKKALTHIVTAVLGALVVLFASLKTVDALNSSVAKLQTDVGAAQEKARVVTKDLDDLRDLIDIAKKQDPNKVKRVIQTISDHKEAAELISKLNELANARALLPQVWLDWSAQQDSKGKILDGRNIMRVEPWSGNKDGTHYEVFFNGRFADKNYVPLISCINGEGGAAHGTAMFMGSEGIKEGSIVVNFPDSKKSNHRFFLVIFGNFVPAKDDSK